MGHIKYCCLQILLAPRNNFFRAGGAAAARAPEIKFFCGRILGQKFIIKNFIRTAAIVFCLPLIGVAQTFVKPGDTGSIEFPIGNDSESVALAEGAEITVDAPAYFIVKNTYILGPVSEDPGQTKTFIVTYEIGQDAPDGSFSANLKFKATTLPISPDPDTVLASVGFKEIYLVAVVGDGLYAVSHGRIVNYMKFGITGISTRAHDALLAKWNTAPYARGVALCQPLARLASAPLARSRAVVARPARGESNLLCGVRQPAASRSAIAARTPWNTASYGDRRIAARAGTNAPAQGLPQAVLRYTASFARVAVAGRTSGGQLPRSPAGDFFFCRPAEKIQKRVFAVLSAKAIKRFFPGATAKDVGGKYYV